MKTKTEKLEKERNEYKSACEKTEAQVSVCPYVVPVSGNVHHARRCVWLWL